MRKQTNVTSDTGWQLDNHPTTTKTVNKTSDKETHLCAAIACSFYLEPVNATFVTIG